MPIKKNNKNYGTKVRIEEVQPNTYPDYLTVTYAVPEANASFQILNKTNNIAGYRVKGATTWETPVTTINVTSANVPNIVLEFSLTDNTKINEEQFRGLHNVAKVEIPSTITTFKHHCFSNCRCLTELPNLNNVTTIENTVFYSNMIKLGKYVINDNVTRDYHYSAFSNGFSASDYMYINGALFHYLNGSFENTINAWNHPLDLSNGIDGMPITKLFTYNEYKTFNGVKLPSTLTHIREVAFNNCNLGDVYMYSTVPPTTVGSDKAFKNCTITNFYVPQGSLTAYQTAYPDYVSVMSEMS